MHFAFPIKLYSDCIPVFQQCFGFLCSLCSIFLFFTFYLSKLFLGLSKLVDTRMYLCISLYTNYIPVKSNICEPKIIHYFFIFFFRFQWYYDYEFTNCYTFNGAWGNNKQLERAIVFNPVTGKSTGISFSIYECFKNVFKLLFHYIVK